MRAVGRDPRRHIRWVWAPVFLLILGVGATLIVAGEKRRRSRVGHPNEEVRETIQVLMILRMKKELRLSPEQEMKVVPRVQELFEQRQTFAREHQEALRQIRLRLREESLAQDLFRESVVRLDEMERSHQVVERHLQTQIDQLLNPRQQAQLRLFMPEFRRQIQRRIDQAWRLQEMRRALPAPPPPPPRVDEAENEF